MASRNCEGGSNLTTSLLEFDELPYPVSLCRNFADIEFSPYDLIFSEPHQLGLEHEDGNDSVRGT